MLEFQIAEVRQLPWEVNEDLRLEQNANACSIYLALTMPACMLDAEEFSSTLNVRSAMNDLESIEKNMIPVTGANYLKPSMPMRCAESA